MAQTQINDDLGCCPLRSQNRATDASTRRRAVFARGGLVSLLFDSSNCGGHYWGLSNTISIHVFPPATNCILHALASFHLGTARRFGIHSNFRISTSLLMIALLCPYYCYCCFWGETNEQASKQASKQARERGREREREQETRWTEP